MNKNYVIAIIDSENDEQVGYLEVTWPEDKIGGLVRLIANSLDEIENSNEG